MDHRIARPAFAIATLLVAIMAFAAFDMVANDYARSRRAVDPAFAPAAIAVPESYQRRIVIPHKGREPTEHDGRELYRESFERGWHDCAAWFIADWKWGEGSWWNHEPEHDLGFDAPWLISAPDEINYARADGWRACRQRIEEELETRSEIDVRAMLTEKSWWQSLVNEK